jgi:hypothetical protein
MAMQIWTILAVVCSTLIIVLIESYLAWRASNKKQDKDKENK